MPNRRGRWFPEFPPVLTEPGYHQHRAGIIDDMQQNAGPDRVNFNRSQTAIAAIRPTSESRQIMDFLLRVRGHENHRRDHAGPTRPKPCREPREGDPPEHDSSRDRGHECRQDQQRQHRERGAFEKLAIGKACNSFISGGRTWVSARTTARSRPPMPKRRHRLLQGRRASRCRWRCHPWRAWARAGGQPGHPKRRHNLARKSRRAQKARWRN